MTVPITAAMANAWDTLQLYAQGGLRLGGTGHTEAELTRAIKALADSGFMTPVDRANDSRVYVTVRETPAGWSARKGEGVRGELVAEAMLYADLMDKLAALPCIVDVGYVAEPMDPEEGQ